MKVTYEHYLEIYEFCKIERTNGTIARHLGLDHNNLPNHIKLMVQAKILFPMSGKRTKYLSIDGVTKEEIEAVYLTKIKAEEKNRDAAGYDDNGIKKTTTGFIHMLEKNKNYKSNVKMARPTVYVGCSANMV